MHIIGHLISRIYFFFWYWCHYFFSCENGLPIIYWLVVIESSSMQEAVANCIVYKEFSRWTKLFSFLQYFYNLNYIQDNTVTRTNFMSRNRTYNRKQSWNSPLSGYLQLSFCLRHVWKWIIYTILEHTEGNRRPLHLCIIYYFQPPMKDISTAKIYFPEWCWHTVIFQTAAKQEWHTDITSEQMAHKWTTACCSDPIGSRDIMGVTVSVKLWKSWQKKGDVKKK